MPRQFDLLFRILTFCDILRHSKTRKYSELLRDFTTALILATATSVKLLERVVGVPDMVAPPSAVALVIKPVGRAPTTRPTDKAACQQRVMESVQGL